MIRPEDGLAALDAAGIRFITGVPDSLLSAFCATVAGAFPPDQHLIAANEGAAVGAAIGHYLATGRPALVYLQNSGLGNAINPLVSLASPEVYGIPMVLLVGWRGEVLSDGSQRIDEPQHLLQGRITRGQLDLLGVPHRVLGPERDVTAAFAWAAATAIERSGPVALAVRAGSFAPYQGQRLSETEDRAETLALLSREEAIGALIDAIPEGVPVVCTTGMASRELFERRKNRREPHDTDFLTVGGMGHALSIAGGIARSRVGPVMCLDGDGALLMHMGALTDTASLPNLIHVVLNNGAHDSVGGQPTAARHVSLANFAAAAGHRLVLEAHTLEAIRVAAAQLVDEGCGFLEIRCRTGSRPDLGRPDVSPHASRDAFARHLRAR